MMVNHEDKKVLLGAELIEVKRGSRITSEVKLADRWGWSRTKVRSFLSLLEQDNMIERKADNKKTTLTIVNYNDYQVSKTAEKQRKNNRKTTEKHQKNTNNNDNNNNNDNKDIYSDFEKEIISLFPGKKVKSNRDKKVPNILKEYSVEEVTRALERYKKETEGTDRKFILNESTWWNGRYIDYLDDNYTELPKREIKQQPTYSGPSKKTKFHNFDQRTDKYTADELNSKVEEKARKKREEYLKKLRGE